MQDQHDGAAELEKLVAELDGQAYAVTLVTGDGRRPRLHLTNRQAARIAEHIYADSESFWWGWAERIAPVTDVAAAAAEIDTVLRRPGDRR